MALPVQADFFIDFEDYSSVTWLLFLGSVCYIEKAKHTGLAG